ncbi:MAG: hypothetical protein AAGA03_02330 [Planctomycetota bacterium]
MALTAALLSTAAVRQSAAEPIGLMERYAFAADRQAVLAELIPGTEDHYFYHCLYYQTSGQLDRSEAVLKEWLASRKGRTNPAIQKMTDRQRLLTYDRSPEETIEYLKRRLGVQLSHSDPIRQGERRYPSELDQEPLQSEALITAALKQRAGLKPIALRWIAEQALLGKRLPQPVTLRDLLGRVDGPYLPKLDQLVIKELDARRPNDRKFGDLSAHHFLTLDQLDRVAKSYPQLAASRPMVDAVLVRLRPSDDVELSQDPDARLEHLQRVEAYTRSLPAAFNSLKASATYRLLEANLATRRFDRNLFVRYLQLPRVSPIVHPIIARRPITKAQLNQDFSRSALLPPIGNEEPLVRTYLEHFLKDATSPDAFSRYVEPTYLKRVFAETKLLEGIGDSAQWYQMLSPSQRQRLRDAVQLSLTPDNPKQFDATGSTALKVDVKNVNDLVIRIYQINTNSYHETNTKPLDTDIDLDGLIPTVERRLSFDYPAVRRHREAITLDAIEGRGVWVVDLVGKGKRSRALIRRGQIDFVQSESADGMVFTIIDENRSPLAGATMKIGSREFTADDKGVISLPPVTDRIDRRALIGDGTLTKPIKFRHLRERYALTAGMHVDQTQLQSGGSAELLVRPRLSMSGNPVDPAMLKQVSVKIEATDLDGLTTSKQFDDLQLDQNSELTLRFRAPSRLINLKATLTGKIDQLADAKLQTLETTRSWDVSGIRSTANPHDALLTRRGKDYVIEVRGRTGELVSGAMVRVSMSNRWSGASNDQTLQSDDQGLVKLGPLAEVIQLTYGLPGGSQHIRDLRLNVARWPNLIHSSDDRDIRLPLTRPVSLPQDYRLIALRGGMAFQDQSKQLSTKPGFLAINALPAGDYRLIDQATGKVTQIVVSAGDIVGDTVAGQYRHLELAPTKPLSIGSAGVVGDELRIQLVGDFEGSRVHLLASRYLEPVTPIRSLSLPPARLNRRGVRWPASGFVSDLRLGDEYQYVLRRRYAKKYPGVMLPQPGILLNPWETEETSNQTQSAATGQRVPPSAMAPAEMDASDSPFGGEGRETQAQGSDYDFLKDPGTLLDNLRPDAKGVITVPLESISGLPIITVVAGDPTTLVQQVITLRGSDAETNDLRLAKSLDPKIAYSFQRGVSIVGPNQPLDMKDLGTARLQVYASVDQLMSLYENLVQDKRFAQFGPLAKWHTLSDAGKQSLYTRLASHELHLFLWAHDRAFFDSVIKPYLTNKKEKQFVDHWLLESDLSGYLQLWQYNQLNAAEKALLAMRLQPSRSDIVRDLNDLVASQDKDFEVLRRQIDSALRGQSMETEGQAFGYGGMMDGDGVVVEEAMAEEEMSAFGDFAVGGMAGGARFSRQKAMPQAPAVMGQSLRSALGRRSLERGLAFFRLPDATKQWAESQWDRIRVVGGPAPAGLIQTNSFWLDLAQRGTDVQLSEHLLQPTDSRHAALVALAMCGLPMKAGDVSLPTEKGQAYAPEHAVAVVTKRLQRLTPSDDGADILIGQRFVTSADQSDDDSELTEFIVGVPYRGVTVVSNPTGKEQLVDLFWQLPAGSLPLAGGQATDSRTLRLPPFAVQAVDYQFYFPQSGSFTHYPATASQGGTLMARAAAQPFNVVDQPSNTNRESWEAIARSGSPQQIRDFLAKANLHELDWMLVAHRMRDQGVYRVVTQAMASIRRPLTDLWGYSFHHRDKAGMQNYLALRQDLVGNSGPVLSSPLLDIDPLERRTVEHLEYSPLVRARIHRLGESDEILNATFLKQYRSFAQMVGYQATISDSQRLVLTYYLLLQNRIDEAIDTFAKIQPQSIESRLQYDYAAAYLAMHQGQYQVAEQIAQQHAGHAIPRWRDRFDELTSQLRQRNEMIDGPSMLVNKEGDAIPTDAADLSIADRNRRQQAAADQQAEVIARIDGNELRIDHRQTDNVTVNFYGVDLELLFSKTPFVRDDLKRMVMVKPTLSESLSLDQVTGTARVAIPVTLRRQTLLVEVTAGASRSTALYYGGELTTYVSDAFGQLQVTRSRDRRPVSAAYVKIYGKYPDGKVRFYKDGYTDARGRFDYASISAASAQGAERFAILVIDPEQGATLHDVASPNQ